MLVLGVMSGSSMDGLDMAVFEVHGEESISMQMIHWTTFPMNYLQHSLERLNEQSSVRDFLQLEVDYSKWIGECINQFIHDSKLKPELLSIHGHTVSHLPEKGISSQLAAGGVISKLTGIPTITDFRQGDITLQGMGTPLTPILDQYFYSEYDLIVNLGGICNISFERDGQRQGYDLFPCNQVSNFYARKFGKPFDKDGEIGAKGRLDVAIYDILSNHKFLKKKPPKSIDNIWIQHRFIGEIDYHDTREEDKLHTFYQALSSVIISEAQKLEAKRCFFTGGGTHNKYLITLLETKAAQHAGMQIILPPKSLIDYKECQLMALIGYLRFGGRVNILSSVTGADKDSIGGALYI